MAEKNCPKCNKKSEDVVACQHCGINFDEYETAKQEKLIKVRVLLSENKYSEAKELAEKLPSEFPDNRTDFLLLLSNINRDISIVEKYELARKAYEEGDFSQSSLLLRNIKAFDQNLNDKVISLRRKAQRYIESKDTFRKAVEEFDKNNYSEAKTLFRQILGFEKKEEVSRYLEKIKVMYNSMLDDAIASIKQKQFESAREKLIALQATFPDMHDEIDGYLTILAKRVEIKDTIFNAAIQAKKEQRLLESKILFSFLGTQFPEFKQQILPHLKEIGKGAVISLADMKDSALMGLAALGLDETGGSEGQGGGLSAAESKEYVKADTIAPNRNEDGYEDIDPVVSNRESAADTVPPHLEIDEEGVADFAL